jgi:hypothetical protein
LDQKLATAPQNFAPEARKKWAAALRQCCDRHKSGPEAAKARPSRPQKATKPTAAQPAAAKVRASMRAVCE